MPTFDVEPRCRHDFENLSAGQQEAFARARQSFIRCLLDWEAGGCVGLPQFPGGLRVKPVQGHSGVWEMTWAGDGRATWGYGVPRRPGRCHIVWRRIGTHRIFDAP